MDPTASRESRKRAPPGQCFLTHQLLLSRCAQPVQPVAGKVFIIGIGLGAEHLAHRLFSFSAEQGQGGIAFRRVGRRGRAQLGGEFFRFHLGLIDGDGRLFGK